MISKFSKILFLLLLPVVVFPQDFQILESTNNSIVLKYSPKIIDTTAITVSGRTFTKFTLLNSTFDVSSKEIEIPLRQFKIGVPSEYNNTIQIVNSIHHFYDGVLPFPPVLVKEKEVYNEKYVNVNSENAMASHESVEFGSYGLIRGLPVQTIKVYPVQQSASNRIKIIDELIFKVNFANAVNIKSGSVFVDQKLNDIVLNYEVAKKWNTVEYKLNKSISSTKLHAGTFYKFPITEEGIYKITKSDLTRLGISADVDPRKIKIYNNGGYQLSYNPDSEDPRDVVENAIYVEGESDGKFDDNDFVLFYGRGTDFWEYNSSFQTVRRKKNYYSKENYYWITAEGDNGLRMELKNNSLNSNLYPQIETHCYEFMEEDNLNLLKSGVVYVGDEFSYSSNSNTYTTAIHNQIPGSQVIYSFNFVNHFDDPQRLTIYENNQQIFSSSVPGASGYALAAARSGTFYFNGTIPNSRSVLKFVYQGSDLVAKGYLDFFEINYRKSLKAVNDELFVYSKDTTASIKYNASGFSNSSIWGFDISNYNSVNIISPTLISGGQFSWSSDETQNSASKYILLTESKFRTVPSAVKVENSNIHGITDGAEYVIITHSKFLTQAERLLNYRMNGAWEKLTGKLILIDEIFNEFNSGLLDPSAIRNFLKYAFDNWQIKPFYVVFFGDGDYDYLNSEGYSLNFIPTFQTIGSFDEVFSYPYDDYFARISGDDSMDDVAIGRICVQTVNQAESVVDKIINYETSTDRGLWHNSITLVADDGLKSEGDDGDTHTKQSEALAFYHIPAYFDLNKLYLSRYPTVNTGLGRRKPAVNEEILKAVNNGTLILNFIGHGNPQVWTHEVVFDKSVSIPQFRNDRYFMLTAATCDFGRYDDPGVQSGTEEMLYQENAGIIGGISAVRPVYSNSNAALAYKFYDKLLGNQDSDFLPATIGRAYFNMKQERTGDNDEKYHLFGDPALRLNEPHLPVSIDSLNGKSIDEKTQIKALGSVSIAGSVLNSAGNTSTNVNGEVIISIYDSERSIYLSDINYSMDVQGGLIYRGRASVKEGKFSTSFTVPKDISYENKEGKIVVYFLNDTKDGVGVTHNFLVGGTDSTVTNDGSGPKIDIYFDDLNYENSYLVNQNFSLLVKLSDETGLNTTGSGVGHKLEGVLNDDETNAIDFTRYFVGDLNTGGKSGLITYKFSEMTEGDNQIKVKAWDVFNNFSSTESYFTVVNNDGFVVRDVLNYPNPFRYSTTFTFQHNLSQPIDVKIKVYTIAGRLINEIEEFNIDEKFVKIDWDGRDKDGDILANGTYLYKLILTSTDGAFKQNFLGKLAVIR